MAHNSLSNHYSCEITLWKPQKDTSWYSETTPSELVMLLASCLSSFLPPYISFHFGT